MEVWFLLFTSMTWYLCFAENSSSPTPTSDTKPTTTDTTTTTPTEFSSSSGNSSSTSKSEVTSVTKTSTTTMKLEMYHYITIGGSGATIGLTFVAVVGICCILSRIPKKKQDSVIEMKRTERHSSKPVSKASFKQRFLVEDEAATDHFEDWHNIKFNANNHFSQTDEDAKRDTIIGAIYPI